MIFRQFGRTELLAKLTERSVEQVRSETAERSAEHVRFGRTLTQILRKIKFEDSRNSKSAIHILGALDSSTLWVPCE